MRIGNPQRRSASGEARPRARVGAIAAVAAIGCAVALAAGAMHGCGGGSGDTTPAPGYPAVLAGMADEIIVPGYEGLAGRASALETSARAFCAAPSASGLEGLRSAWRDAMAAWLEVTWIEFGPIEGDNRRLRIQFWPDANNNVRRSVDQLLARSELLDETFLAGQSVAAQGLPALELLLFDPSIDALTAFSDPATGPRRCALAAAISANLSTIADELVAGWRRDGGGFVDQLARAGSGSTAYASPGAALEEVVNAVVATVEQTKNDRLGGPLGAEGGTARPERVESRPSGNSLPNVEHAVEGLRRAIAGAGFDIDAYLRQIGQTALADRIGAEMDESVARARAVPAPLADAIADPEQADELQALFDAVTRLTRTLKNDLPAALGVTIGFNSNDGD